MTLFLLFYLHISKISSNFAAELVITYSIE